MKKYTAGQIHKQGLLLKRGGEPYSQAFGNRKTIVDRLKACGFTRTGKNDQGTPVYQVTQEDIQRMNRAIGCSTCQGCGFITYPDGPDDTYSEPCEECQS